MKPIIGLPRYQDVWSHVKGFNILGKNESMLGVSEVGAWLLYNPDNTPEERYVVAYLSVDVIMREIVVWNPDSAEWDVLVESDYGENVCWIPIGKLDGYE